MNIIELKPPYLIFVGDITESIHAKTGKGLVQWRPELCKAQIKLAGCEVDLGVPEMTIDAAVKSGVKTLIVGTSNVGGGIPDNWLDTFIEAAGKGLDIAGGLHTRLDSLEPLRLAADKSGSRLIDIREAPKNLPVGSGKPRNGRRVLMVGTDCAVGKKYTALALERDMSSAGLNVDFRASGQTGIMIAGGGIPIDSIVSDFISGAAELLSPDNEADHWDVIEGQGGILHPGFGAVSFGLLMGSQPDAFVVCHEAGRKKIKGWPEFDVPSIKSVIQRTIDIGGITNPNIHCVGISVNTSGLDTDQRDDYLAELSGSLNLPCIDPLIDGTDSIIDRLLA